LVVSNEQWGDVWFSKQHYAYELARLGHQIYFINPTKKWKIKNFFSTKIVEDVINNNLSILTYQNNLPQGKIFIFFVRINDYFNCLKIKRRIKHESSQLIWWKFDPYRFLSSKPLKGKIIYHVVDPHLHLWQDKIQAKQADLIISSSEKYINSYKKMECKNIIKIPHGISDDEFELDQNKVVNYKKKYGDYVIIIGTIAADVNINLIRLIALEKINIVVIGPEAISSNEWEAIKKMKNVHYLGSAHAKELKHHIAGAKAGLITYNFISKQKGQVTRTPLKALNYLAQNLPVITTIDSEIKELENKGVYWAKNENDYLRFVKHSINSELNIDTERIKSYLNQHQYSKLISNILKQLAKC